MNTQAFSAAERHFLIGHTLCFLAALVFFLQGTFLPCLICMLLLGLSLPLFLLSDKPSALFIRHTTESPKEEQTVKPDVSASGADASSAPCVPSDTLCLPTTHTLHKVPALPAASDLLTMALPIDDSLSVLPGSVKKPVSLNLLSVCEEMGKDLLALYRLYPSQLQILSEEKDLILSTDQSLLTLILRNLMDNGAKYARYASAQGGRFTLTLSRQGSDVLLIFRNNTCGVQKSEIPYLTKRNQQGSNRIGGTGLGLFQAGAAVNSLQGSLQIKSSPITGFAVYLRLPDLSEPVAYPNSLPPKEETHETA